MAYIYTLIELEMYNAGQKIEVIVILLTNLRLKDTILHTTMHIILYHLI